MKTILTILFSIILYTTSPAQKLTPERDSLLSRTLISIGEVMDDIYTITINDNIYYMNKLKNPSERYRLYNALINKHNLVQCINLKGIQAHLIVTIPDIE